MQLPRSSRLYEGEELRPSYLFCRNYNADAKSEGARLCGLRSAVAVFELRSSVSRLELLQPTVYNGH